MAVIAPSRSLLQRMTALERANLVRSSGAEFKREIAGLSRHAGHLHLARTLWDRPERIASLKVHEALEAVPGMGKVAVRKILTREHIWPLKTVAELTDRQRSRLGSEMAQRAGGWC